MHNKYYLNYFIVLIVTSFLFISSNLLAQTGWQEITKTTPNADPYDIVDDFGYSIAIDGDFMVVGVPDYMGMSEFVPAGVVFVYQWVNFELRLKAKLTTSSKITGNKFGHAVAISGDFIVVGAYAENNGQGAAYLYEKPVSGWSDKTETARLTASDPANNDEFGYAVTASFSANTVVVGSYLDDDFGSNSGSAYVFEKPENGWADMTETVKLTSSDNVSDDYFGRALAMDGNTLVVASLYDDDQGELSGSAYIFEKPESGWTSVNESAKLTASDGTSSNFLGRSVDISDDVIVLGADGNNSKTGAAYVYQKIGDSWSDMTETAKLTASDGVSNDKFANKVAISGDYIAIAAFNDNESGSLSGKAYVFEKPNEGWLDMTETGKLTTSDGQNNDYFARAIAVNNEFVMIGAKQVGVENGALYEYGKPSGGWTSMEESKKRTRPAFYHSRNEEYGRDVDIDGNYAVVAGKGEAYVYEKVGDQWQNVATLTSPTLYDHTYADCVAISGDIIVVAPNYVFKKPENGWTNMLVETTKLNYLNSYTYSYSPSSIDVSGNTIVLGAEGDSFTENNVGKAYIYELPSEPEEELFPIATLKNINGKAYDDFGYTVAIDGEVVIVSDYDYYNDLNEVYVFQKPIEGWVDMTQTAELTSSTLNTTYFGLNIDIQGDYIIVGNYNKNNSSGNSGIYRNRVSIYEKPENGWLDMTETASLTPSHAGSNDFMNFGVSLQISENKAVVGSSYRTGYNEDNNFEIFSGAVYVFNKPESGWVDKTEDQIITASNAYSQDDFGISVGISGDNIIAGAVNDHSAGVNAGSAYFLTNNFTPSLIGGSIENQTFDEDDVNFVIEDLNTYFTDPENQTLSYSAGSSNEDIIVSTSGNQLSVTSTENYFGDGTVYVNVHDGSNTFTSSFQLTINPVNDDPSDIMLSSHTVFEGLPIGTELAEITSTDIDSDDTSHTYSLVEGEGAEGNTSFTISDNKLIANEVFEFDNQSVYSIRIKTEDGNGGAFEKIFEISIDDFNQAPSFTKGVDQLVAEDAGAQTVTAWATNISDGNSSNQTLTFNVVNDNNNLFAVQPAIDANGNLSYTSAENTNGSATVTISLSDNGGTDNGGVDTSDEQTFTITITAINDAPAFQTTGGFTVIESTGSHTINNFATVSNYGPEDENDQSIQSYNVSNDNNDLFSQQPFIDNSGNLTFTIFNDISGSATVTVSLTDNGGTENGGVNTSEEQTFNITVILVNNAPSFSFLGDQESLEDGGMQTVNNFAAVTSFGSDEESEQSVLSYNVTNNNNDLFLVQPAIDEEGNLTYTANENLIGEATVTVSLTDNGGTENGGLDTSSEQTFTITINSVNDAPTFEITGDITTLEDATAQTINNFVSTVSFGPTNEEGQTVSSYNLSNDNNALFVTQPSVDNDGNLSYSLSENANGTASVIMSLTDNGGTENGGVDTSEEITFTITVTPVNDQPSFSLSEDQIILEDAGIQTVNSFAAVTSFGPEDESDQVILAYNVSNDNNSLFDIRPAIDTEGNLTYTPANDAAGEAIVTVSMTDNGGTENGGIETSVDQTFTITINPVNDAPSFEITGDITVLEDATAQTINNFVSTVSFGPTNEEGQAVSSYNLSNDNNTFFTTQPIVDNDGNLSYSLSENANGVATVTISLTDNGGTENGGVDTSGEITFTITITPVNDQPSFTLSEDQSILEDEGTQTVSSFAVVANFGPEDESDQSIVAYNISNDNNSLFDVQPAIDTEGNLTYTPANDAVGEAIVTVSLTDNGGTENGGIETSVDQTFTITITPVNDAPSFEITGDITILEDEIAQTINSFVSTINFGSANEDGQAVSSFNLTNNNNTLFISQPTVDNEGNLTYSLSENANGEATVTMSLTDNGGIENGGVDTSEEMTFTITIIPVNDQPSFSLSEDQNILEDAGTQTVNNFASVTSFGPEDESDQSVVAFNVSNSNNSLFEVQPALDINGNLTYIPANNAFGEVIVTVSITDNGGLENGGEDTSLEQTFIITINPVNDAPTFEILGDITVVEDANPQFLTDFASIIDFGATNEGSQSVVSYNMTNNNTSLFDEQPAVDLNGNLTFTLKENQNGSAFITINLTDNGGTENGGINTSETLAFLIDVTPVNDAPSFSILGDATIFEDSEEQSVFGFALVNNLGPEDENNQTITVYNVSNNHSALFDIQPTIDINGMLNYKPKANAFGEALVTVSLTDDGGTENGGENTSEVQSFKIFVTTVNDSPVITTMAPNEAFEDIEYSYVIGVSDPDDANNGIHLIWNLIQAPSGMTISNNGVIRWTPTEGVTSSGEVIVSVQDGGEDGAIQSTEHFIITVVPTNDNPVIINAAPITAKEDILYSYQVLVSDPDDENNGIDLTWSLSNAPAGMTISDLGLIEWIPLEGVLSSGEVTVNVSDGGENNSIIAKEAFTITVTPVNDSPVIISTAPTTGTEEIEYVYAVLVSDPDDANNGTSLNWELFNAPSGMSITNTGVITWTPEDGVLTSGVVTINVYDGGEDGVLPASETFIVEVNSINDAPVLEEIANVSLCPGSADVVDLATITSDPDHSLDEITFYVNSSAQIEGLDVVYDDEEKLIVVTNNTDQLNATITFEVMAEDALGAQTYQYFDVELLFMEIGISQDGNILTATYGESYQWFRDGVIIPETEGGTERTITASLVGKYKVAVSYIGENAGTCVGTSNEIDIDNLTSLKLNDVSSQISVYPNPVVGFIQLEMNYDLKEITKIQLYDIHGMLVLDQNNIEEKIDVSELPKGVYILQMMIGEKNIARKRVVKN